MLILTPLQLRLARTALGLGVRELAQAAEIAPSTVTRFELGKGGMNVSTLTKLTRVLEDSGVIFIAADAQGGPGVRLKA